MQRRSRADRSHRGIPDMRKCEENSVEWANGERTAQRFMLCLLELDLLRCFGGLFLLQTSQRFGSTVELFYRASAW
jgi:hypothetical protein